MRSATGNTAGPERPPVTLASIRAGAVQVYPQAQQGVDQADASAPAASQALAMATISVTFGESFTITGFGRLSSPPRSPFRRGLGSVPKLMPPPWTFGQEIFTSSQPTCRLRRAAGRSKRIPPRKSRRRWPSPACRRSLRCSAAPRRRPSPRRGSAAPRR